MESSSQAGRHRKWDTVAATWGVPRPEMSRSSCEQRLHGSSLQEGSFLVDLDVGECGEVQKLGAFFPSSKRQWGKEKTPGTWILQVASVIHPFFSPVTSAESESPCSPSIKIKNTFQPTCSSVYREAMIMVHSGIVWAIGRLVPHIRIPSLQHWHSI